MEANHTIDCFFLTTVQLQHEGGILVSEIVCCFINLILALTATLFNSLVIFVIWKTSLLHSPCNVLIACLAGSDLVIGMFAQPLLVAYKIAEISDDAEIACNGRLFHWIAGFVCGGVSVMTIATIAVDKMLALHLHLRYKQVVTVTRVLATVSGFWFFCVAAGFSIFIANSDRYWTLIPIPVLSISLSTTLVAYVKVFKVLRRHRNQIRTQTLSTSHNVNMKKYKKSVLTMVYVLLIFLACYTPLLTSMVIRLTLGYTPSIKMAYEWSATITYLNSSLNPVVYWVRMQEIRVATVNTMRKIRGLENESRIGSKIFRISVLNEGFNQAYE